MLWRTSTRPTFTQVASYINRRCAGFLLLFYIGFLLLFLFLLLQVESYCCMICLVRVSCASCHQFFCMASLWLHRIVSLIPFVYIYWYEFRTNPDLTADVLNILVFLEHHLSTRCPAQRS
ncbi:unnamed protein product [Laminaria digitata]